MKRRSAAELLEKGWDRGYPTDYLLSRIKGKKARFVPDWKSLVASPSPLDHLPEGHYQRIVSDRTPEGIWRALLIEYRWLYHQMNGRLQEVFAPYFVYAELRTVFICLRNLKEMKRAAVKEMLSVSLLSDQIRRILVGSTDELAAARAMEEKFLDFSGQFSGIAETLHQRGLAGFEHELTERYLAVIVRSKINPVLQTFFTRLIDARNILSLAKLVKMSASAEHPFISGGSIDIGQLQGILATKNRQGTEKILKDFSGENIASFDLVRMEASLYRGISRSLKKKGKDPLGVGPILGYLWRCSIEAMNLSVLAYSHELERDIVAAELVR